MPQARRARVCHFTALGGQTDIAVENHPECEIGARLAVGKRPSAKLAAKSRPLSAESVGRGLECEVDAPFLDRRFDGCFAKPQIKPPQTLKLRSRFPRLPRTRGISSRIPPIKVKISPSCFALRTPPAMTFALGASTRRSRREAPLVQPVDGKLAIGNRPECEGTAPFASISVFFRKDVLSVLSSYGQ